MTTIGTLYGIGVGPGDSELITVKGLKRLQQAVVVAFPAGLSGQAGVAERIIQPWLLPHQTPLALTFPYVQDDKVLEEAWERAARKVWTYLSRGVDVAFCSEGDVSFYSTFTYLAQAVQRILPSAKIEIVPGVCSPMAAAAALGIPLTIRAQRLTILPALYTVADLETALNTAEIVVLMKVSSVYRQVWSVLEQRQLLAYSAVIDHATWDNQVCYIDLRDRPSLSLSYFSLLIVQVPAQSSPPAEQLSLEQFP
jgi:precorrin-2/cobalt-factor-2 C20-methyltransferase